MRRQRLQLRLLDARHVADDRGGAARRLCDASTCESVDDAAASLEKRGVAILRGVLSTDPALTPFSELDAGLVAAAGSACAAYARKMLDI